MAGMRGPDNVTGRPPVRRVNRATTPSRWPSASRNTDRAKVAFALVGLLVIVSLLFGGLAFGGALGGNGANTALTPGRPEANLVPTYEARLRENPNDAQAMVILANILQNNGDYPGAIAWYERAVAQRPGDVETRLAFGQALASYGKLFDAEVQYQKALELQPTSARAEYLLGLLDERWNPPRTDEAKAHYERASRLEPEGGSGRAARAALQRLTATPVP